MTLVLVVYSEAIYDNDEESFRMKIRQIEDDDEEEENAPFNNSEDDDNDEKIENVRRKFSPCEPCGLLRRSCCFPNLCQHRSGQISQCLKV
ncbi:unnamed protein product [Rotaria sp. Silwood1]|nr:unnamed protein product [Rotaria sp. Silwood1]